MSVMHKLPSCVVVQASSASSSTLNKGPDLGGWAHPARSCRGDKVRHTRVLSSRLAAAVGGFKVVCCLVQGPGGKRQRRPARGLRAWQPDGCDVREGDLDVESGGTSPKGNVSKAKVALLLNRNAKGVTHKIEKSLAEVVGAENCFVCCSLDDAKEAVREVLARGTYISLACGGGDGTLASVLNLLATEVASRRAQGNSTVPPSLAVLRLGTGNGLAYLIKSRWDALGDLKGVVEAAEGQGSVKTLPAKILAVTVQEGDDTTKSFLEGNSAKGYREEILCFFAGLGYDARMLTDYVWIKKKTEASPILRRIVHGPQGYAFAWLLSTLPATLKREHVFRVKVTSLSDEVYYLDPARGDWAIKKEKGAVLFEGEAGIVMFGAVPFYGGGMKVFPFAGMPGGLAHLRISNIHPAKILYNLWGLFRGTFRSKQDVWDFLVEDVLIEAEGDVPFQHSGELVGGLRKFRVHVKADGDTQLVDFA